MSEIVSIMTHLTLIVPFIAIAFNTKLLFSSFLSKTLPVQTDMALFYLKMAIDTVWSISIFVSTMMYSAKLASLFDMFIMSPNFAFYVVWFSYPIGSMRALLVLLTGVERALTTFTPINTVNYRNIFSTTFVSTILFSYFLFDGVIMFLFSGGTQNIQTGCMYLTCLLGTAYDSYWLAVERILYTLLVFLLVLTVLKLHFCISNFNESNTEMTMGTRLVLISTVTAILFILAPSFIFELYDYPRFYLGPVSSFFKSLGLGIEANLVSSSLKKMSQKRRSSEGSIFATTTKVEPSSN